MLGIPNYELQNVFATLEGDPVLDNELTLSPLADEELQFVEQWLKEAFCYRIDLSLPLQLLILPT